MSTVQKIFVVINFALAIAFTFLSLQMLALEQKWKNQYADLKKESDEKQADMLKEIDDQKGKIKNLDAGKVRNEETIRVISEAKEDGDSRITDLLKDLNIARESEMTQGELIKVLSAQNEDLKNKLAMTTNKFRKEEKRGQDLVKIYQFKQDELADVIAELNDLKAQFRDLEEEHSRLEEKANGFRIVLERLKQQYHIDALSILAQPAPLKPIEGKVVAVAKDKESGHVKLVMLSVGKNDRVEKGYQFVIFRNDLYIGKVVVDKVFEDMATASVVPESMARDIKTDKPLTIEQYDSAATQVY